DRFRIPVLRNKIRSVAGVRGSVQAVASNRGRQEVEREIPVTEDRPSVPFLDNSRAGRPRFWAFADAVGRCSAKSTKLSAAKRARKGSISEDGRSTDATLRPHRDRETFQVAGTGIAWDCARP